MIGNTLESPKLHRVGPSQFENSRTLASRLLADPALRVGFYLPVHLDERSSGGFSAGFWRAQQEFPVSRRVPILLAKTFNEAEFGKWLRRHKVNVLFTTPQPVMQWLERLGVRVPDDVRIAFPGDPTHPGTSFAIAERWPEIHVSAIDFLISELERNHTGIPAVPQKILIAGTIVES